MKTLNTKRTLVRFRRPLILTVGFLSLIIVGSIFISTRQANREGPVTQTQDSERVSVTTATATQETLPIQISVVGTTEASATVSVKSDVDGQLTELYFTEGQFVKKGEPLFTIDSRFAQANLDQGPANHSDIAAQQPLADADLIRDRAQARAAEVEADRYDGLYKEGVVSKEEDERMRAIADGLVAVVKTDEDAITNAQGSERVAEVRVDSPNSKSGYHSIRSPIDGLVKGLVVSRGDTVTATDATSLVTIEQVNPIYVSFGVPQLQLTELKRCVERGGLQVAATIANDASHPEQGSMGFIDDSEGGGAGTVLLKAIFDNKDRRLQPDQLVDVVLTLTLPPDAVVIPSSALQTEAQGHYVFVVKTDQTVESRAVVVAQTVGGKSILSSGLDPGEVVVKDSKFPLQPGSRVNATGNTDALADTDQTG